MKLHLREATRCKKDYKRLLGHVPIDQAMIESFFKSIQSYIKEDGRKTTIMDTGGKIPTHWNPEWVRAAEVLRFGHDWTRRAFAIRGAKKDIANFAHSIAWDQRVNLSINTEYANLRFRTVWQTLNSTAVHDWVFAKSVADNSRNLISGATCYHNIAKAVFLLLEGNLKKAAAAAKLKDSGSAKFFLESQSIAFTRALCSTIVAAADNDPIRVAHGLKLAMINVRDRAECARQAQGLAAILRKIDSRLLDKFDGSRLDAWDDELWNWTASNSVSFAALNLKPLSHELHETLVDLKEPQWFKFKASPIKEIKVNKVHPPASIPDEYWPEICKSGAQQVIEYVKEMEVIDNFIKYRKLNKKKQPDGAFAWLPGRAIEQIQDIYNRSRSTNLDMANWFEKQGKSKSTYWAINQFEDLVTVFVDPVGDKDLFQIRRFKSSAEAIAFAKDAIAKQKSKGFVSFNKQSITPERIATTKVKSQKVLDPNQQSVADFWQAFGVPKLQAQQIAKKAAKDFEKRGEDSILQSMKEKAIRRQQWQKEQERQQKKINRETSALKRELKNATKPKTTSSSIAKKSETSVSKRDTTTKGMPKHRKTSNTAQARRFEFVEGNSSKFWTVQLNDTSLVTLWGRIGTSGQTTTKDFPTSEKASIEYEKLVREKTSKGYKEVK